jgi:hypothetical protein
VTPSDHNRFLRVSAPQRSVLGVRRPASPRAFVSRGAEQAPRAARLDRDALCGGRSRDLAIE